ncbi:ArsA family ATPase [Eubacterium sp.]|uniref:ArsA family ATPase n=1 Tax=Eubacterium sp. TaxID=142586 RepID=UPI002FC8C336
MGRIMIFTGKGGVGKSSIASAHALQAAKQGMKTLLISTDMAHNLGDLFEITCGQDIQQVTDCLDILEIDPEYEMAEHYGHLTETISHMLPGGAADEDGVGSFMLFPGMVDLFSLLRVKTLHESGEYEMIIVDCAPTGETLALLKLPELLSWYMEKLFPVGRVAVRVMRPISRHAFKIELPDQAAMNDIQALYLELSALQKLFKNSEVTTIRMVAIPEKMVVAETKRSLMYLNLYGFTVDGLVINRVLPAAADADFFREWHRIQAMYQEELGEVFRGLPIRQVPWYEEEVKGPAALRRIAQDALDDADLFARPPKDHREIFEKSPRGYTLILALPQVEKGAIDLHQGRDDLILRIGNFKRCIPLPDVLRKTVVSGAALKEGVLRVNFEETQEEGQHEV